MKKGLYCVYSFESDSIRYFVRRRRQIINKYNIIVGENNSSYTEAAFLKVGENVYVSNDNISQEIMVRRAYG